MNSLLLLTYSPMVRSFLPSYGEVWYKGQRRAGIPAISVLFHQADICLLSLLMVPFTVQAFLALFSHVVSFAKLVLIIMPHSFVIRPICFHHLFFTVITKCSE